jgi:hypothetical protein
MRKCETKSVDRWNATMHVGDPVTVTRDDGRTLDTVLASAAWKLGGHTPVAMVEGICGCYLLDRIKPRREADSPCDDPDPTPRVG